MNRIHRKPRHQGFLKQYSLILALLALCALLALKSPAFLTGTNILIVFRQISINAILAIGVTFVILTAGISYELDAIADALQAVKAGHLDATVFQNARAQGATAVETVLQILKGQAYEPKRLIPFELVTQENVDDYLGTSLD